MGFLRLHHLLQAEAENRLKNLCMFFHTDDFIACVDWPSQSLVTGKFDENSILRKCKNLMFPLQNLHSFYSHSVE